MSLLEKATSGKKPILEPSEEARASLFARALASSREEEAVPADASEPLPPKTEGEGLVAIEGAQAIADSISALPPSTDSILALWKICSSRLPLAALSLFLPRDGFLSIGARSGFPSGSSDPIPVSVAPPSARSGELLAKEAAALLAPLLGVPLSMALRAAPLWSDSGLLGLWVYYDPALAGASEEAMDELAGILSSPSLKALGFSLENPPADPAAQLLAASKRFSSVSVARFDLDPLFAADGIPSGVERDALRSAFLASCRKILSLSGAALACGDSSVICALGSSSDADLALFQFTKTLKRILPFLASLPFPTGRALNLDPASAGAAEELSRFISA
jgi:hypothetical protein